MLTKLRKPAYTLFELVIVIVIMALVIAFAIPAFRGYGKNQAYNQQVEEIKALMNQTYIFSRNPEQGIDRYELSATGGNGGKFSLIKYDSASASSIIKEISIPSDEDIQCSDGTGICYKLICYSDPSKKCVVDDTNPNLSITIYNNDPYLPEKRLAKFDFAGTLSLKTGVEDNAPFSIKTDRTD